MDPVPLRAERGGRRSQASATVLVPKGSLPVWPGLPREEEQRDSTCYEGKESRVMLESLRGEVK